MGFLKQPKVDLAAPAPPPVPPLAITPEKRPKKPMAPTFMGAEATPQLAGNTSGTGGKSLLGGA